MKGYINIDFRTITNKEFLFVYLSMFQKGFRDISILSIDKNAAKSFQKLLKNVLKYTCDIEIVKVPKEGFVNKISLFVAEYNELAKKSTKDNPSIVALPISEATNQSITLLVGLEMNEKGNVYYVMEPFNCDLDEKLRELLYVEYNDAQIEKILAKL